MPETQTAYAKSAFTDPVQISNVLEIVLASLALPQVVAVIPLSWMPFILAFSGIAGIFLRRYTALHPVVAIAPREVKPIEVPKLTATQVGSEEPGKV